MANSILNVQISCDGGIKSPIITGASGSTNAGVRRLSFYNIAKLILGLMTGIRYKQGASWLQYQTTLVSASATCTPATPAVNDTLTIAGTALTAKQGRATGTVTFASASAADTVTINGVVFTAVSGAVTPGAATFDVSGSDTAGAASLASQFAAYVTATTDPLVSGLVGARSAAAILTFYAVTPGTAGNALTLATSNNTRLAKSGTVLANGAALTNNQFDCKGTDITTGAAIVAAIAASTTTAIQSVSAASSATTGVVTVTAKVSGVAGNAVTFTSSSNTTLAVTGSGFLASGSAGEPVRLTL